MAALPPKTTFGKYELRELLGQGGLAEVYRAYQPALDRPVAIKLLHGHLARESEWLTRFTHEASALARLRHPNVVQVYDFDVEDGKPYMVMEYVGGLTLERDLAERNAQGQKFTFEEALALAEALASALDYAHARGVVHHDVKPANVLLTPEGQVVLADFGIAHLLHSQEHAAGATSASSGTPTYMAPEQCQGARGDTRSDLYALGVILYEIVAGRPPFVHENVFALLAAQINEPPPPLVTLRPDVPPAFAQAVLRTLSKDPDLRPQTGHELTAALRAALDLPAERKPRYRVAPATPPPCPYRGLFAFREEDAPFFFGRDLYTLELLDAVKTQPLVALVGPSGSGKSSLVFAGLLPALRHASTLRAASGQGRLIAELRPGSQPFHALAVALSPWLEPAAPDSARLAAASDLADALCTGQTDLAGVLRLGLHKHPAAGEWVLVIDQWEELYTLCQDEALQTRFVDVLLAAVAARAPLRVILTLRADFMALALAHRAFADVLQHGTRLLGPLTPDELEQAITAPALKQGVVFEPGLAQRIVSAVRQEPGQLPLLEFALTRLWEHQADGALSHRAYDALGQVSGALAAYADAVYAALSETERAQAQRIFVQLIQPGAGTEDTRRVGLHREFTPADWAFVQHLAAARLVVTDRDPVGGETVELVHEALIRHWGLLRGWMAVDREFRAWQERLRAAQRSWEASAHDDGALLRGALLAEAEEWSLLRGPELAEREREFIAAGLALRDREAHEREAQRQRELDAAKQLAEEQARAAQAERQRAEQQLRVSQQLRTRAIWLSISLALAALFALAAFGFSQESNRNAAAAQAESASRATQEANARTGFIHAEAQRLAAEANTLLQTGGNADLVALLAIRSLRIQYTPQGDAVLGGALALNYPERVFSGHESGVEAADFSADGTLLVSGGNDTTLIVWEVATGRILTRFAEHHSTIMSLKFDPTGRYVLSGDQDGTVWYWEATTGKTVRSLSGHTESVNTVGFVPGQSSAFTSGDDATVRLWDLSTGRQVRKFDLKFGGVCALAPDGLTVVTGSSQRGLEHWDLGTGELIKEFIGHTNRIDSVAFSPDGRWLVTSSIDKTARLWDVETGEELRQFSGHSTTVFDAVFSPDARYVLTSSEDKTARLWDTATGQEVQRYTGHSASVTSVAFAPKGDVFVTASADSTIRLWALRPANHNHSLRGHTAQIWSISAAHQGDLIATSSVDSTARIWSTARGELLQTLRGHVAEVWGIAFAPDDATVATAALDGTVRLWDVQTGQEVRTLAVPSGLALGGVAISADGRWVAAGGDDRMAYLWDFKTGELVRTFGEHEAGLNLMAFSPDGRYLATTTGQDTVYLWDVATAELVHSLDGHISFVTAVAFAPDSSWLVTSGADATARIWDTATGKELRSLRGHTDQLWQVDVSPDGRWIATASSDGTARLWDAATGAELRRFAGHTAAVQGVTFLANGRQLATVSDDATVRLWDLDYDAALEHLCGHLLRDLTPEEQAQYGITATEPTCD